MAELPIISVAGLMSDDPRQREAVAAQLGRACRDVGFFYVIDHGIPAEALKAAFEAAQTFFALPLEQKQGLSIKRSPHNRGYVAMSDEKLNPAAGADRKEAFNIGTEFADDHPDVIAGKPFRGPNFWPDLPEWRQNILQYFDACLQLGRVLHRGFSLDLGLAENFFESHLSEPIATLRLLHYPPSAGRLTRADGGAGTHTDYGNVTVLATDTVAGLEVLNRQGEWVKAPHVPGAFVCNIGDCLMRWSNNIYVSTPHRVRPPERERYAIAFFLEANPDSVVDPGAVDRANAAQYAPITCADYLSARLNATYEHLEYQTT